ncbi:hypothetical protein [Streptomyces gardneri]|uniref:hypothetical protein n=1 Tax=Streptomyces gardneri TaxID=66892 RepID=UPI003695C8E7
MGPGRPLRTGRLRRGHRTQGESGRQPDLEIGAYDFESLSELLAGLDDLEGTGYTPRDVEDITALLTAPLGEVTELAEHHGEPNEDVFRPKISMSLGAEMFDRWRVALDAHPARTTR